MTALNGHNRLDNNNNIYKLSILNSKLNETSSTSKSLIVLTATINGIRSSCLIDSGAGSNFISSKLVKSNLNKFKPHSFDAKVTMGDGKELKTSEVIRKARVIWNNQTHLSDFIILPTSNFDVILGTPWLNQTGAIIDIRSQQVKCDQNDIITINRIKPELESNKNLISKNSDSNDSNISQISSNNSKSNLVKLNNLLTDIHSYIINSLVLEDGESHVILNVVDITTEVEHQQPMKYRTFSDIENPIARKLVQQYSDIFVNELPSGLPPHRSVEFGIELEPNSKPPSQAPYKMSGHELSELSKIIQELLEKKLIRPSESPYGAPVVLIRKKDGSYRLCLDYRKLNEITIKNAYGLPRIDEMFDRLAGAKIYTQLDCQSGYWQMRVKESDISKTAFRSRVGHYEWMVMPQGVTNGPATFSALMQNIFSDIIDKYFISYLDDMLIYSKNQDQHIEHCKSVFNILRKHKIYCQLAKCKFFTNEVNFLGHVINQNGVQMQLDKIKSILNWSIPKTVKQLRGFLGLTGYYRKFIKGYSIITAPLTNALRGKIQYQWNEQCQLVFDKLKQLVSTKPILIMPDDSKEYIIACDACKYGVGAVLQQNHGNGLQPIAYFSKKFSKAQLNYSTYEQELVAIILALREWRCYLDHRKFKITSDHRALQWLKAQSHLNDRQQRWSQELSQYNFKIEYIEGKANVVADALSRIHELDSDDTLNTITITLDNNKSKLLKSKIIRVIYSILKLYCDNSCDQRCCRSFKCD